MSRGISLCSLTVRAGAAEPQVRHGGEDRCRPGHHRCRPNGYRLPSREEMLERLQEKKRLGMGPGFNRSLREFAEQRGETRGFLGDMEDKKETTVLLNRRTGEATLVKYGQYREALEGVLRNLREELSRLLASARETISYEEALRRGYEDILGGPHKEVHYIAKNPLLTAGKYGIIEKNMGGGRKGVPAQSMRRYKHEKTLDCPAAEPVHGAVDSARAGGGRGGNRG